MNQDNNIIDIRIEKFTLYESENHISIDTTGYRLCDLVKTERNKDTAAFIVKACNEYDKLKAQIDLLYESLKDVSSYLPALASWHDEQDKIDKINASLLKSKDAMKIYELSLTNNIIDCIKTNPIKYTKIKEQNILLLDELRQFTNPLEMPQWIIERAKEAIKKHSPIN